MDDGAEPLAVVFSFRGRIGRGAYLGIALVGVWLKHLVDSAIATTAFHRPWTMMNYVVPLGIPVQLTDITDGDRIFLLTMLAVSIPFALVGLAITVKRFRTVGWPLWLAVLFFVPVANIVSFAIAAALPDAPTSSAVDDVPTSWKRFVPAGAFGAALLAMLLTGAFSALLALLSVVLLHGYGWGLFVALPFAQGALAACLFNVRARRSGAESALVAMTSVLLTAAVLVAVAVEGFVCVVMALPIAIIFALIGGAFGHAISGGPRVGESAVLVLLVLAAPGVMGAEAALPREATLYAVRSEVVVNAPPSIVWRNVIRFPDLPAPTDALFLAGVAYPERARIVGSGVGAVRYCQFSTGDFVEPITVWEPGRALAFNVAKSAEPMREWSPYGAIDTPHLHGYLVSRRGRFDLEPLPGGRTRLIGTTWYQHHLWPESYWALIADAVIHRIHLRVLDHVKALSEAPALVARE
jgi:uncharacterized membrane protein YhaH (DUF805 family)